MRPSFSTAVVALLAVAGKGLSAPLYPSTCYFGICPTLPGITKGSDDGNSNYKARDVEYGSENVVKRTMCFWGFCPMLPIHNNDDGQSSNKARDTELHDDTMEKRTSAFPGTCYFGICPTLPDITNSNEKGSNKNSRDVEEEPATLYKRSVAENPAYQLAE